MADDAIHENEVLIFELLIPTANICKAIRLWAFLLLVLLGDVMEDTYCNIRKNKVFHKANMAGLKLVRMMLLLMNVCLLFIALPYFSASIRM